MESGSRNSESSSVDTPKKKPRKQAKTPSPPAEEVGSFLENIKMEWSLFWAGIAGEDETPAPGESKFEDPFETGKLHILTIEQVKQITRALSQDRKKINQKIEQINREIDLNTERLDSIKLVSGDSTEIIGEINKLNDIGMKLGLQLEKVSHQLDRFRSREDELKGLR